MNKIRSMLQAGGSFVARHARMIVAGAALALGFGQSVAHATIDAALTSVVSDVSDYFDTIKAVVIAVVVFGIAIAFARLLKRR